MYEIIIVAFDILLWDYITLHIYMAVVGFYMNEDVSYLRIGLFF